MMILLHGISIDNYSCYKEFWLNPLYVKCVAQIDRTKIDGFWKPTETKQVYTHIETLDGWYNVSESVEEVIEKINNALANMTTLQLAVATGTGIVHKEKERQRNQD